MTLSEVFFFTTILTVSLTMGATMLAREHFAIQRIKTGDSIEERRRHGQIVTRIALGGLLATLVFYKLTQFFYA